MKTIQFTLSEEEISYIKKFTKDAIKDALRQIRRGYSVPIYQHRLEILEKLYVELMEVNP